MKMSQASATAKQPCVSVCIPTYNGSQHLAECINSVIAQTYRDFEVVICDDQSSDGTLDLARQLAGDDKRFRFILNPQRFGLAGNWNNCIRQARGEWIKFVFQDDVIFPTCIEKLLAACRREKKPFGFCERDFIFEAGTAGIQQEWFNNHKARIREDYQNSTAINVEHAVRAAARSPSVNLVGEPTVTLIHKTLFEELGDFDPVLIHFCDGEFWCRVMINYGATFVPESLGLFRVHAGATTAANHKKRQFRTWVLDTLVLRYRIAFDPHFKPLRQPQATGKSVMALRLQQANMALDAWSQARDAKKNGDDSLMKEWTSVVSVYPRLRTLVLLGRGMQFFRDVRHQIRVRLPKTVQKWLGHESSN